MSFEKVLGNNKIKDNLIDTINNNNVSHSYMFIGQEGVGKKQISIEYAKMILCLSENRSNCDFCNSCIKFNTSNHPDFLEVKPDGNYIKISQIRELQTKIYQKPIISDKKVIIIDDAEKMTEEAQNSLLKTLEEPPKYIVIILIVSNENLLLNTIKSRCLKLYFNNLTTSEITTYIKNNNVINNPTENVLNLCNGSIGKIEKIVNNMDLYNQVEKLMNDILDKKITSIIDIINNADIIYKSKDYIFDILEYLIVIAYGKIKNENMKDSSYYKNVRYVSNIIKIIETTKSKLYSNSNYEMCIDEMLLKIWEEI